MNLSVAINGFNQKLVKIEQNRENAILMEYYTLNLIPSRFERVPCPAGKEKE